MKRKEVFYELFGIVFVTASIFGFLLLIVFTSGFTIETLLPRLHIEPKRHVQKR